MKKSMCVQGVHTIDSECSSAVSGDGEEEQEVGGNQRGTNQKK
jgi:hypothetical protein